MIHRLQSENTRLVRQVEDLTFWTGLRYRQLREADEASIRLLQQDSARSAFMDSLYGRVRRIKSSID